MLEENIDFGGFAILQTLWIKSRWLTNSKNFRKYQC
jgi:hypothetical protein